MESYYRPTRAEIDLNALEHNLNEFRNRLPAGQKIMATVKANAYGHGAVGIAKAAVRWGVDYLSVAFLDEAIQLRQAGIASPILVLGHTPAEGIQAAIDHDITLNVYTNDVLEAAECCYASKEKGTGQPLRIHVKVDTGMGRIGILAEDAVPFIQKAMGMPGVRVEGVFTHFACADEADLSYTHMQYQRFQKVLDTFEAQGVSFPLIHTGNSAAAIQVPEWSYSMVRLGISMYGLYPSDEVPADWVDLKPVMRIVSRLSNVKTLPPGEGISYGVRYYTQTQERIGTVPIGYADGYSRMLTGKAEALVRGQRVPVVGTICMDQCMLNLTILPEEGMDVGIGEEVVLMGRQGDLVISAEDIAAHLGTINYEVTCMVAHRIPRVYLREGRPEEVVHALMPVEG
ncbi:alanine racemase [Paenibacillus swuensis]|uniref:Alanine racemase n=1 Tax=Paenibacillus swuensis TaxID=1178515 RepID=A0A172TJ32_9BACL|nr:alanine racemase [Paenibacillus swuensis]ANE47065.1 alanine racemase [Paenibacillus swuensis]